MTSITGRPPETEHPIQNSFERTSCTSPCVADAICYAICPLAQLRDSPYAKDHYFDKPLQHGRPTVFGKTWSSAANLSLGWFAWHEEQHGKCRDTHSSGLIIVGTGYYVRIIGVELSFCAHSFSWCRFLHMYGNIVHEFFSIRSSTTDVERNYERNYSHCFPTRTWTIRRWSRKVAHQISFLLKFLCCNYVYEELVESIEHTGTAGRVCLSISIVGA